MSILLSALCELETQVDYILKQNMHEKSLMKLIRKVNTLGQLAM